MKSTQFCGLQRGSEPNKDARVGTDRPQEGFFFCVGGASDFGRSHRDTIERVGAWGTPLCCRRNRVSAMRSGTFWTGQYPSMASWARLGGPPFPLFSLWVTERGLKWTVCSHLPRCPNLPSESLSQAWKPWRGSCQTLHRWPYSGETPLSHAHSLWKQERRRIAWGCYFRLFQQMCLLLQAD